jgi:CO/xanthine dehydrogenase FAD-binding subunit
MDLNSVNSILRPTARGELASFAIGDAWLAGGTWLFSEPQWNTTRLIDLDGLGWAALQVGAEGLHIGATCRIAELAAFSPPPAWRAGPLFGQCCNALLGSFKIWNMATVGGNLCLALPAGPMTSLAVALEARCTLWHADGERTLPAEDFVIGPQQNALRPGELLRAIEIPLPALLRRTAFRQISLSTHGRSAALLIGTRDGTDGGFALTVTAATRRPVRLAFPTVPQQAALLSALDATIPPALYYDDVHGDPAWRAAMTRRFAAEICAELAA